MEKDLELDAIGFVPEEDPGQENTSSLNQATDGKEPHPYPETIIESINFIVEVLRTTSTYTSAIYGRIREETHYLLEVLGLSERESLLLSAIVEQSSGRIARRHEIAQIMGLSNTLLMSFCPEFQSLKKKGFIRLDEDDNAYLTREAREAIVENRPLVSFSPSGLTTVDFFKRAEKLFAWKQRGEIRYRDLVTELDTMVRESPQCPYCKESRALGLDKFPESERIMFHTLAYRYVCEEDDMVGWHDFREVYECNLDVSIMRNNYKNGNLELCRRKIVVPVLEDGMCSGEYFHIEDSVKRKIFVEIGLNDSSSRAASRKLLKSSYLSRKELFFSKDVDSQIRSLGDLLDEKNYAGVVSRLEAKGLRHGFACLFYGPPGTGKTESVYQIALSCGRDILPVDVPQLKSCWVGESEKQVKGLFDDYKALCQSSEKKPILLFNEADAIFGTRMKEATRSVDKMENTLQNIILQEMETLDGILIATTNLSENLDPAFGRRFIYKVRFNRPDRDARGKIWRSMIPSISKEEAAILSERWDFSGGQIENIARKLDVHEILYGEGVSMALLEKFCSQELLYGRSENSRIGF